MRNILGFILVFASFASISHAKPSTKEIENLIISNDLKSINDLVEKGLDINITFKRKATLLHFAADYGKYDIVKYLIEKGADLNVQDKDKNTPLVLAIYGKYISVAELLIHHKADLNIVGLHGETPLRRTIGIGGYGRQFDLLKLLVENGADINFRCSECCNRTIFLYCCGWGTVEMLELLIDKKVSIDQKDCKGRSAMDYAELNSNKDVIPFLIANGINN